MATHYNLEEQEQLAQVKHFWAKYSSLITWLLIAVLGAFAAWNGWQYWQRKSATEAAALFDELERATQASDLDKVKRVWTDMQQQVAGTAQAHHAGLLAARSLQDSGDIAGARQALELVLNKSDDVALQSVARLRLAALEMAAEQHAAALRWLDSGIATEFAALADDRRGDILLAQGQADAARQAYRKAWDAMDTTLDYRRLIEAKLNALGVNPSAPNTEKTQ